MILDKNDVSASMHRLIVLDKKKQKKRNNEKIYDFSRQLLVNLPPPIKFAENCGLHATDLSQFASKLQK